MKRLLSFWIYTFIIFLFPFSIYSATTRSKNSKNAEEILKQGREAFFNYDFDEAADLYDQYKSLKSKNKQSLDEEFEIWEKELEIASNAFERVQRIVVVDSINVPFDKFIDSYRIFASSGKLSYPETPEKGVPHSLSAEFINEDQDFFIYPLLNEEGDIILKERNILLDGSMEERESLEGDFERNGDYIFPFMSGDGQTLYFSNNGEDSMGGFDLFVAQRDGLTGEYRQPLNLGMPFNSPFDDLMLAIDEENGLGWWATNRNSQDDFITIYVFIFNEIRKNYPSDTEDLVDLAKLTSYKDTWLDEKGEVIKPRTPDYNNISISEPKTKNEFEFPLGNGRIYTKLSDFKNRKASDLMKIYLSKNKELKLREKTLAELRKKYKTEKSVKDKILKEEKEEADLKREVKKLKNEVLSLEKNQ